MKKIIQRVRDNGGVMLALSSLVLVLCLAGSNKIEANAPVEQSVQDVQEIKNVQMNNEVMRHLKKSIENAVLASRSAKRQEKKEEKNYCDEDLYWLARIVSAEARGESVNGQIAVANVVLNRVASDEFPDSIKEVIFQKGQFQPVKNKSIYDEPTEEAVESAKKALEGEKIVDEGVLFFYNPKIAKSSWLDTRKKAVDIGNHRFTY